MKIKLGATLLAAFLALPALVGAADHPQGLATVKNGFATWTDPRFPSVWMYDEGYLKDLARDKDPQVQANKTVIAQFEAALARLSVEGRLERDADAVLDKFIGDDYIQHDPEIKPGRAGLSAFFKAGGMAGRFKGTGGGAGGPGGGPTSGGPPGAGGPGPGAASAGGPGAAAAPGSGTAGPAAGANPGPPSGPGGSMALVGLMGDADLVTFALGGAPTPHPTEAGRMVSSYMFGVFRVRNGKVVEHFYTPMGGPR